MPSTVRCSACHPFASGTDGANTCRRFGRPIPHVREAVARRRRRPPASIHLCMTLEDFNPYRIFKTLESQTRPVGSMGRYISMRMADRGGRHDRHARAVFHGSRRDSRAAAERQLLQRRGLFGNVDSPSTTDRLEPRHQTHATGLRCPTRIKLYGPAPRLRFDVRTPIGWSRARRRGDQLVCSTRPRLRGWNRPNRFFGL